MRKNNEDGMTDYQYKCMLIDQRGKWEKLEELLQKGDTDAAIQYVREEIELIGLKLRF